MQHILRSIPRTALLVKQSSGCTRRVISCRSFSDLAPAGSATAAIHADALADANDSHQFSTAADVAPPIGVTTTFTCPEDGNIGHVYSRISNPTRDRCEALFGAIEGTPDQQAHAVLYSSGLAACFGILNRLLPQRVAITGGYHGTHLVLDQLKRISGGRSFQTIPLPTPAEAIERLQPGDLLWVESPINPSCHVADIAAYTEAAQKIGNVRVVVDGTFAPPPLQRPLLLGVDAVMHATTKAIAGHSDVMGGAVCVSDAHVAQQLRDDRTALGSTPGSLEVWLLMRSLRTLHMRVEHQSRTASKIVAWLQQAVDASATNSPHPLRGLVHAVHHASLPSCPGHEIAKLQMPGGYGGCFALELSTESAARALPKALTLFRDATSLGGVESLIEWRRKYDDAISPLLLRISVGLEDAEHLKADLERGILKVSPQL